MIGTTNPINKLDVVSADWVGMQLDHSVPGVVGTLKWAPAGTYGTGRVLVLSNETPIASGMCSYPRLIQLPKVSDSKSKRAATDFRSHKLLILAARESNCAIFIGKLTQ